MRHAFLLVVLTITITAHAAPTRLCVVGDSLTQGFGLLNGELPWPNKLLSLHPGENFGVLNVALSGVQAAAFNADQWTKQLKAQGCTHLAIFGPTNDLPPGTAALTIWNSWIKPMALEARAEMCPATGKCIILMMIAPRNGDPSWSAGLQSRLDEYNALVIAAPTGDVPGAITVDNYTGLQDPSAPTYLLPAYRQADFLHLTAAGQSQVATLVQNAVAAAGGW